MHLIHNSTSGTPNALALNSRDWGVAADGLFQQPDAERLSKKPSIIA